MTDRPLRLLLVEDSESDALLIERALRRGGVAPKLERVETLESFSSALQAGSWDAILADFKLPGFTGLDALRVVQDNGLDIPFLLVSGTIGEELAVEAMKAGAHDFIVKGNYARLVPALDRELREAAVRRERRRAEEELTRHREHLQELVRERTSALATAKEALEAANAALQEDIAQRKQAEDALKQTLAELERSNRDLEQFASVASHDLQEPLRMVAGFTQLLAQRYADRLDQSAKDFIGFAVDGATRMQCLIHDLLAYSRVTTRGAGPKPTDAEATFHVALRNLHTAIQETGAEVSAQKLPTVLADATQLTQLFQNLIGNAIKFRGAAPPRVHVTAAPQDGAWLFAVQDNGIGIDPQYSERIFGIFQRLHTSQRYPGTGIGLALCKRVVERHGGRIWVESLPGQGATFYFTLPRQEGEAA